jgi:hypothetical protein
MELRFIAMTLLVCIPSAYAGGYECTINGKPQTIGMPCDEYQTLFPAKAPVKQKTLDQVWQEKRTNRSIPPTPPEDSLQTTIDRLSEELHQAREVKIKNGVISTGMSKEDVTRAKGSPSNLSDTSSNYGNRSTWMYRGKSARTFVHFENNIVVSITRHK